MKISFLDFWGDLDINNNFLINIIREFKSVEISSPEDADVIICSVFGNEHCKFYGKKKIIYYTGENIRPNFSSYDLSFSFDFDDYDGRNIRVPLWYFYVDFFNKKSYGNPQYLVPENFLYGDNEFSKKKKDKFCCTVFSKYDNDRFLMMDHLSGYKEVHGFGKVHPNRLPDGEKIKMDIISDYKFSICFENSIYPGYFTEKILHAKIAGTIPIYKSDKTFSVDFNEKSCLNLCSLSFEEIKDKVIEIDNNDKLYDDYQKEPLFNSKIDINEIGKKIIKFL